MKANRNDLATRFLLGELSEEERREVEERFLSDNEFFEQILASEDALLDEYLSGTLSEEERARAKALFESSREQRHHVEITKQIVSQVQSEPHSSIVPRPYVGSRMSTLAWVAALSFVLLGSWALYLAYRQRTLSVKEAAAEQTARQANDAINAELAHRNELKEQLESERRKYQALLAQLQSNGFQSFESVTLKPGHFKRGDKSTLQTVKVNKPQIRFRLVLETDVKYEHYSVSITTFGGREVQSLTLEANQVEQSVFIVTLPVDVFGPDPEDFKIELKGASVNSDFQHLADYAFRLAR